MLYDYILFEKNDACFSLIHEKKMINNINTKKNIIIIIYIKVKRVCSPSFPGLTKNGNIAIFIHEKC